MSNENTAQDGSPGLTHLHAHLAANAGPGQSEEYYRLLADSLEDFITLTDREGRRLFVSPSFYRVTGYTPEEVLASDFRGRVHPDDLEVVERARLANLRGERTRVEYRCLCRDGSPLWLDLRATPLTGPDGQVEKILCCSRDITDRKRVEEALRKTRDELESRVRERTAELQAANELLQAEAAERLQAEQILRQSEQRFRLVSLATRDAIYDWTMAGDRTWWNERFEELLGRVESPASDWWNARIHPEDRPRVLEEMAQIVAGGGDRLVAEYRFRLANGEYGIFTDYRFIIRDADGRPARVMGAMSDITERRLAQQALERSEQEYRGLFENAHDAILIFRPEDEVVLEVNRRACDMYGFGREEFIGLTLEKISENVARGKTQIVETLTRGAKRDFESVQYRKDGTKMFIAINAAVVDYHGRRAILTINRDVSAQKQIERALRESQRMLQLVLDNIPQRIFWKNRDGVYLGCNRMFALDAGAADPAEVVGKTDHDLVWTKEQTDFFMLCDRRVIETQTPEYHIIEAQRHADGQEAWLDTNKVPLHDEDGKVVGVLGTYEDITERRATEERTRRHEMELARVSRLTSLGELATGLAHELNQPLSAMVTFAEACIRRAKSGQLDTEHLLESLGDIAEQGHRAGQIIRSMRGFVRRREEHRSATDLNSLVREALSLMKTEIRRAMVELRVNLPTDLPRVGVDAIQIEQVLVNLIQNAIDAMEQVPPEHRSLVITTRRAENGGVKVSVRDTGNGITPENLKRIGEPFFTTKPEGLGMGVAISRRIVEAHGGSLVVGVNAPRGARFIFTLPPVSR